VSERLEIGAATSSSLQDLSKKVARRELAGLVRLGFLRRIGFGRGARYVRLSFWLTLLSDGIEVEWAVALL
jgi:hypothetical protein